MRFPMLASLALFLALATGSVLACSAMGPNTHIGQVLSLDRGTKTLTIQDAETRKPITFVLNDQLLLKAASARGQVIVHYNGEKEGRLVATDIQ
ncbi:MAG TPA: hypothetical protein ENK48_08175 [Gammaproteobacteria bacterium]|nr:hypothetical protein [Gammaproteobacteria bacterium]